MMPDLVATQNVTLAGFRLLDPNGIVIAGREEIGLSLAHLQEVAEALQGRFSGVLRVRISKHDQPSLYSISRGTGDARLHRDAGDRARPGRRRRLCLAHAQQCLQVPL